MRVYSFSNLKWRQLVNRLPSDNAILELQYHGVSQLLTRRQEERCVCGTGGQGQQSVLLMRRFSAKIHSQILICVQDAVTSLSYKSTLQQDGSSSHNARSHDYRRMAAWCRLEYVKQQPHSQWSPRGSLPWSTRGSRQCFYSRGDHGVEIWVQSDRVR